MENVNLRNLYKVLFSVFDLNSSARKLLTRIMAGSEKADDYEEILKYDRFFTTTICKFASANMKTSVVSSLGHGVVVVGQQKVRNMVLGHTISRIFNPHADTAFTNTDDSEKNLKYSLFAEEHARRCRNEYPGIALAAGFIYDIFSGWINSDQNLTSKLGGTLQSNWRHGVQTATLAWALATHERVLISHRKIIFAAGLLHEIGKLGLGVYNPDTYALCLEKMKAAKELNPTDDIFDVAIEREHFDLTHPEVGSALVFHSRFLRDVEMEVDYHHDPTLLKSRNPDAFLGVAILNIADRLSRTFEKKPEFGGSEIAEILKPHAQYFPLKAQEVMDLIGQCKAKSHLAV